MEAKKLHVEGYLLPTCGTLEVKASPPRTSQIFGNLFIVR